MSPGRHSGDIDGWPRRPILEHFNSQHLSVELEASNEKQIYPQPGIQRIRCIRQIKQNGHFEKSDAEGKHRLLWIIIRVRDWGPVVIHPYVNESC